MSRTDEKTGYMVHKEFKHDEFASMVWSYHRTVEGRELIVFVHSVWTSGSEKATARTEFVESRASEAVRDHYETVSLYLDTVSDLSDLDTTESVR